MARVILDGCCLGRRKTGNETYVRGLLQGLASLAPADLRMEVLATSHHGGARDPFFSWRDIPLGNFATRNFWTIPRLLGKAGRAVYHATYWTRFWSMPVPAVVTVHDLSFVSFPQGYRRGEARVYSTLIREAARRAAHVLTVSEYSKQDLCGKWGLPESKVTVTYEAVEAAFRPAEAPPAADGAPYILYVGNLHPRKNLVRLLDAFVALKRETGSDVRLRVVGQKAWLFGAIFDAVRRHRLEAAVDFTGYVDQAELVRCYQGALFSVYPSLFEGFGFPVLESMACGCPVVTSRTTSLPEVAGDAALLVDPESTPEIAEAMRRLLESAELRASLRERGLARAARFDWRRTAEQTLDVYRNAAG